MNQLLKVDEWQGRSGNWYVADVHTWHGWRAFSEILGTDSLEEFLQLLNTKYKIEFYEYFEDKDFLLFYWNRDNYKNAHQFKLDVNRVARKKNYLVERSF